MARVRAEIQTPQPGDRVPRSFVVQVVAPSADRVDVFLDPGRDQGGHLLGTSSTSRLRPENAPFLVSVVVPAGRQKLYIHVHASSGAREEVLTLPVTVS
jgi:hypothetical protein